MNPHDSSNETDALIRHYQQVGDAQQPSPDLDDAILSYARSSTRRPERWIWPVSVAAALLLTVGLFARMSHLPSPAERSQWDTTPAAVEAPAANSGRLEQMIDSDVERRPETPAIGGSQSMTDSVTGNGASEPEARLNRLQKSDSARGVVSSPAVKILTEAELATERMDRAASTDKSRQSLPDEQDRESPQNSAASAQSQETRKRLPSDDSVTHERQASEWLNAVQKACNASDTLTVNTLMETHVTRPAGDELSDEALLCLERLGIDLESFSERVLREQNLPEQ